MAKKAKARTPADEEDVLKLCITGFEADEKPHRIFMEKVDRRYRSYRGILERRSDAAGWTNKQHPPYTYQVIETMVASLLDPDPRWKLKARPRIDSPDEIEKLIAGARANEILLSDQLDVDGFGEKQHTIGLQGLIAGMTVAKNFWNFQEGPRRTLQQVSDPILNDRDEVIGFQPRLVESSQNETYRDSPTFEPVDVRDWIPHESAVSLDKCARVHHRVYYDFDELKELEAAGIYANVDELKESQNPSYGVLKSREQELFQVDRTRDKIEVIEHWIDHGRRVVTTGNRKVVLRDKANPFWFEHLQNMYPFVVCSASPDLFRIPGISEVEMIQELQEILWTLTNQRLDNLQLINNAIVLLREDMDDPDSFDFYPGARNMVSDPQQVKMWSPETDIANLSLEAESIVKNDLQNIVGASPALMDQQNQNQGAQTATEVSLVTNLAQRRLALKKQQFKWMYRRTGLQWIAMNQQFIRKDRFVPIIGASGEAALEQVSPLLLQGQYQIDVEPIDESMMRQERRAEAQAKLQVAVAAAPVFAASQTPLNLPAFMDDYLDSFNVDDKARYYSSQPQPGQMAQTGQQDAPGQPPPVGANGATAPQAIDANSPSNQFSQSPVAALQRQGAMAGGPVNQ